MKLSMSVLRVLTNDVENNIVLLNVYYKSSVIKGFLSLNVWKNLLGTVPCITVCFCCILC